MIAQFYRSTLFAIAGMIVLASCTTPAQSGLISGSCYDGYFVSSKPAKTIELCEQARQNQSASILQVANANLNLGRAFVSQEKFTESLDPLGRVIVLSPNRPEAHLELAKSYNGLARYRQAIAEANRVPQLSNLHLAARFERARAYSKLNSLSDLHHAVEDFSVVREGAILRPRTYAHLGEKARLQLVSVARQLGDAELRLRSTDGTERALDAFETAYQADPSLIETKVKIAQAALQMARFTQAGDSQDQWLRKAYEAYTEVARRTNSIESNIGAAQALQQLGRHQESVRYLEKVAALQPSERRRLDIADAQIRNAQQYLQTGQSASARSAFRSAITNYEAALAVNERNAQTYSKMAAARLKLGERELARKHLEKAIQIRPDLPNAHFELGKLYFNLQTPDYVNADASFRQVLTSTHSSPDIRADSSYFRSRIALEGPNLNAYAAVQAADKAVAHNGDNSDYRRQACLVRVHLGDVWSEAARSTCTRSNGTSTPEDLQVEGMFYLRRAHYSSGGDKKRRLEDAYSAFTKGLQAYASSRRGNDGQLHARLTVGQGIAQYCVGFAQVGQDIINSSGHLREPTRAYFDRYQVAKCTRN